MSMEEEDRMGMFYYVTMKGFERENAKRLERKSVKLTSNDKVVIHRKIIDFDNPFIILSNVKKELKTNQLSIDNYEDLFNFFSNIDMCLLFKEKIKINQKFKCKVINGNFAWISRAENGHFRYFSKLGKTKAIGLDFIDLAEILYGKKTTETIGLLIKNLNIKFMEDIWMNEQNKKYLLNLTIIHNAKKYITTDYPELFYYIKSHLKVLETMNVLGNINIKKQEFSFKNNNIFFASNSYIADFLGNYTKSTTNKVINLLAVLGLIEKLHENFIPPQLLHESKAIAERRNLGNIISYYIVPSIEDVIEEANERAKVLLMHDVRYHNITKSKIKYIFGKEFANRVYVQEIQRNKKCITNTEPNIQDLLEENMNNLINSQGYTTKSQIVKIKIPKTNKEQRNKELEKIFKSLIIKNKLKYVRPTLEIKDMYNLKNSEYVLILCKR